MIERVLTNLLDNAIRHTPPEGTIEVELASLGGRVSVTVSDTGPGIPEQRVKRCSSGPSRQAARIAAAGSDC